MLPGFQPSWSHNKMLLRYELVPFLQAHRLNDFSTAAVVASRTALFGFSSTSSLVSVSLRLLFRSLFFMAHRITASSPSFHDDTMRIVTSPPVQHHCSRLQTTTNTDLERDTGRPLTPASVNLTVNTTKCPGCRSVPIPCHACRVVSMHGM